LFILPPLLIILLLRLLLLLVLLLRLPATVAVQPVLAAVQQPPVSQWHW
jgi:hypothetical protein